MDNNLIQDLLILERKISQIVSTIEVTFSLDVVKTNHVERRSNFTERGLGGNQNPISNGEMSEFVSYFKREISEGIANGDIVDQTEFVIKSLDRELAMAIVAKHESNTYWKLIIKTVFRESIDHRFKTGVDQLVYEK